eukprot:285792-Pleurochrysis_carterae.AAC.1
MPVPAQLVQLEPPHDPPPLRKGVAAMALRAGRQVALLSSEHFGKIGVVTSTKPTGTPGSLGTEGTQSKFGAGVPTVSVRLLERPALPQMPWPATERGQTERELAQ